MTQESMEYPVFRALMDEAHGVTEGAMLPFIPEEDADTRAAWAKVGALLEKHVSGLEAQAEIEDAIIEHEQAAVWLAYKNGIRVALELQKELRKIAAPATPGGVMAAAAGAGDLQRGRVAAHGAAQLASDRGSGQGELRELPGLWRRFCALWRPAAARR